VPREGAGAGGRCERQAAVAGLGWGHLTPTHPAIYPSLQCLDPLLRLRPRPACRPQMSQGLPGLCRVALHDRLPDEPSERRKCATCSAWRNTCEPPGVQAPFLPRRGLSLLWPWAWSPGSCAVDACGMAARARAHTHTHTHTHARTRARAHAHVSTRKYTHTRARSHVTPNHPTPPPPDDLAAIVFTVHGTLAGRLREFDFSTHYISNAECMAMGAMTGGGACGVWWGVCAVACACSGKVGAPGSLEPGGPALARPCLGARR
jgi:hypothetical protein